MFYDITMFVVAVSGILGVSVYSYKIFHSKVYVVGIVQNQTRVAFPVEERVEADDNLGGGLAAVEMPIAIPVEAAATERNLRCEVCGTLQVFDPKHPRCQGCDYPLGANQISDEQRIVKIEGRFSEVNAELSVYHLSLATHQELLKDMEKRIRQLERESLPARLPELEENGNRNALNSVN